MIHNYHFFLFIYHEFNVHGTGQHVSLHYTEGNACDLKPTNLPTCESHYIKTYTYLLFIIFIINHVFAKYLIMLWRHNH